MPFELIYDSEDGIFPHWLYQQEVETMRAAGLTVALKPSEEATTLLRRGLIIGEEDFPDDPRYLQDGRTYANHGRIDRWYPLIADLTMPTVFCDHLDERAAAVAGELGWSRTFVKNSLKSLVGENPLESVWPDVSFESMLEQFSVNPRKGSYALRQYLPPEHFESERRYWVVGDQIHHSSGRIPGIVKEAKARLDAFGGVFYTIDATEALIVEINPGESSDRKTNNTAEDFASWIRAAFGERNA
jgi:hypothetical protein